MAHKIKILHVGDWVSGGLATYIETILDADKHYKHFLLASLENSEKRVTNRDEFIPIRSYKRTPTAIFKAFMQTREEIQKIQPDILYAHSSFAGVFARVATLRINKRPKVIYCAHGWSFLMQGSLIKRSLYRWLEKGLALISDAIIVISHNEYKAAVDIAIDKKKLFKIHHGISSKYDSLHPNNHYTNAFNNNKINILFLGRYDKAKGFDWLMNFIKKYPSDAIQWHCAGQAIVDEEISIPSIITNHAWVEHKDIAQLLLQCDALIMPSRWEGFGLSVIEAMKYSKPVIASKNGALTELIEHNINGYLFDLNEEELLYIIKNLNGKKLKVMGEVANSLFEKKYTDVVMLDKLDKLINDLVSIG